MCLLSSLCPPVQAAPTHTPALLLAGQLVPLPPLPHFHQPLKVLPLNPSFPGVSLASLHTPMPVCWLTWPDGSHASPCTSECWQVTCSQGIKLSQGPSGSRDIEPMTFRQGVGPKATGNSLEHERAVPGGCSEGRPVRLHRVLAATPPHRKLPRGKCGSGSSSLEHSSSIKSRSGQLMWVHLSSSLHPGGQQDLRRPQANVHKANCPKLSHPPSLTSAPT